MLAAKTKELEEEEEEGREAMEVEEERAKVIVMEVQEEKVGTATGEVCDTKEEEEEAVPNGGEIHNGESPEKEEEGSCDQSSQPLDLPQ